MIFPERELQEQSPQSWGLFFCMKHLLRKYEAEPYGSMKRQQVAMKRKALPCIECK